MRRLILAILVLWLITLLVPSLRERAEPRMAAGWDWTVDRLEGPLSPITNRYRRVRAEAELDKAARLMVLHRNQGIRLPDPERLPDYLTRHDIADDGLDPWGTPYLMVQEADSVALISAGPDLRYETQDDLVRRVGHRRPASRP